LFFSLLNKDCVLNSRKTINSENMKNLFVGLASLMMVIAISSNVSAQESFGNAGLEIALPVGDWAEDAYGIGIGGSGGYEFGISDNFAVNANVGIIFFSVDDAISDLIKSAYMIPIQVGGRYYISEAREGLFVEGKLGLHMNSVSTEDFESGGITVEGESETEAYFSFAPQVGFFINENLSVALRYQIAVVGDEDVETVNPITGETTTNTVEGDNIGYIGLKAAYNF